MGINLHWLIPFIGMGSCYLTCIDCDWSPLPTWKPLFLTDPRRSEEILGVDHFQNREVEITDPGPWNEVWWPCSNFVAFPVIIANWYRLIIIINLNSHASFQSRCNSSAAKHIGVQVVWSPARWGASPAFALRSRKLTKHTTSATVCGARGRLRASSTKRYLMHQDMEMLGNIHGHASILWSRSCEVPHASRGSHEIKYIRVPSSFWSMMVPFNAAVTYSTIVCSQPIIIAYPRPCPKVQRCHWSWDEDQDWTWEWAFWNWVEWQKSLPDYQCDF